MSTEPGDGDLGGFAERCADPSAQLPRARDRLRELVLAHLRAALDAELPCPTLELLAREASELAVAVRRRASRAPAPRLLDALAQRLEQVRLLLRLRFGRAVQLLARD